MTRCAWAGPDPLYVAYHDREWGVPLHDDRALFELLTLEGAQAGLSWLTVLRKREAYREAFHNFEIKVVARFDEDRIHRLLQNAEIIRNKAKMNATVRNAQAVLELLAEFASFDSYLWRFVDGHPIQNHWTAQDRLPATSKYSDALSKDLLQRGFKFVGPTICYAFMQASGMVNDHVTTCFRYPQLL